MTPVGKIPLPLCGKIELTSENDCLSGAFYSFEYRPDRRFNSKKQTHDKIKEFIALLCNRNGNKKHIKCFSYLSQHGVQVCAPFLRKRSYIGSESIHVRGKTSRVVC